MTEILEDISALIENLKTYGFAKGSYPLLTQSEIDELEALIEKCFEENNHESNFSADAPTLLSLIGRNDRLDELIHKMLCSNPVKKILTSILGENLKIWQINARKSIDGDPGLYLHQDSYGETNFVFLLKPQKGKDGNTAFLPCSHLIPRWAKNISWAQIGISKFFLKPFEGKEGDFGFFFNKTWHARFPNREDNKLIILCSFFPEGGVFKPDAKMQDALPKIKQSELYDLLSVKNGVENLPDGRVKVLPQKDRKEFPFAVKIEQKSTVNFKVLHLYILISLLELFFKPLQILYRILKKLKSN
ncbi:putative 2OG-Fe(II) oxygenase [Leptospira sp. 201903071]|uniref:putative 2OG-Fe(II) oxygenase n=1 Tax=Leptospira ainazelensis TaxID=2810034 RepID=UPI001966455D|nr:putative 2OG-Fe(II) oxygenase [Leptospira ainazelensis]MBM9501940.1 putative 2OG-Fe(II) oxygenase [Leptospira ainazelensis]